MMNISREIHQDFEKSQELDQRRDDPLLRTEMARYVAQVSLKHALDVGMGII